MDPLLDEMIVVSMLRIFPEFLQENLQVHARQEAYGPSRNEGLCFESCVGMGFSGDLNGVLYFGMDGYTKIKLLPRISERFNLDPGSFEMLESVMLEFGNQLTSALLLELEDGGFRVHLEPPVSLNNKLVPIDASLYRQYILIFFLRDRRKKQYLGRTHIVLTIRKH